jgi:hypothetical protein
MCCVKKVSNGERLLRNHWDLGRKEKKTFFFGRLKIAEPLRFLKRKNAKKKNFEVTSKMAFQVERVLLLY